MLKAVSVPRVSERVHGNAVSLLIFFDLSSSNRLLGRVLTVTMNRVLAPTWILKRDAKGEVRKAKPFNRIRSYETLSN